MTLNELKKRCARIDRRKAEFDRRRELYTKQQPTRYVNERTAPKANASNPVGNNLDVRF